MAKDKFKDLGEEFKDAIAGSSVEEIRKRICDIAILEVVEKQMLAQDPDVEQAKEALDNVASPYREAIKEMRLKIEFCKQVLDDKGSVQSAK